MIYCKFYYLTLSKMSLKQHFKLWYLLNRISNWLVITQDYCLGSYLWRDNIIVSSLLITIRKYFIIYIGYVALIASCILEKAIDEIVSKIVVYLKMACNASIIISKSTSDYAQEHKSVQYSTGFEVLIYFFCACILIVTSMLCKYWTHYWTHYGSFMDFFVCLPEIVVVDMCEQ